MEQQAEIIQINISGIDKPGVTSSLTDILARHDAFILDIGQANIHQTLSLGILFKTTTDHSGDIMKDLLLKAYELDINMRSGWLVRAKTATSSLCSDAKLPHDKLPRQPKSSLSRNSISTLFAV